MAILKRYNSVSAVWEPVLGGGGGGGSDARLDSVPLVVTHGSVAGTARPTAPLIIWIGAVSPTNALSTDLFIDTTVLNGDPGLLNDEVLLAGLNADRLTIDTSTLHNPTVYWAMDGASTPKPYIWATLAGVTQWYLAGAPAHHAEQHHWDSTIDPLTAANVAAAPNANIPITMLDASTQALLTGQPASHGSTHGVDGTDTTIVDPRQFTGFVRHTEIALATTDSFTTAPIATAGSMQVRAFISSDQSFTGRIDTSTDGVTFSSGTSHTAMATGTGYGLLLSQTITTAYVRVRVTCGGTTMTRFLLDTLPSSVLAAPDAITVTGATIDGSGHLILTFSDSTTFDAGVAKGATGTTGSPGSPGSNGTNGTNGLSVTTATINGSGHLILTLSDASTIDAGTATAGNLASAPDVILTSPANRDALMYDTASTKWINVPRVPIKDSNGHLAETEMPLRARSLALVRRTGAIAETYPRRGLAVTGQTLSNQRITLTAIGLLKGQVVNTITFCSGATALATGVNQWACLYSSAGAKLGVSADATSGAWAANVEKTFTLASPYTVTGDDYFYVGIMVNATTTPSIMGTSSNAVVTALAPRISGFDNAISYTTPASAPSTLTFSNFPTEFYAWVA